MRRFAVGLIALAVAVLTAAPARADDSVSVDGARLPAPASAYPGQLCAQVRQPGADQWVFEVRDSALGRVGELVAVTGTFVSAEGGTETVVTPAEGARQVTVTTPPGWLLTAAEAEVTGSPGYLELVATCPAAAMPTPKPPAGVVAGPVATPTPKQQPVIVVAAPVTQRVSRGPSRAKPTTAANSTAVTRPETTLVAISQPLPVTDIAGMVVLGTGLTLAGLVLLALRRRRPIGAASSPAPEIEDVRRATVVAWRD